METLEQKIEGVVDAILEDYRHQRQIDKLDILRLPDKDVVIDVIGKLRRIGRDYGAKANGQCQHKNEADPFFSHCPFLPSAP